MDVCRLRYRMVWVAVFFLSQLASAHAFEVSLFVPRDETVFWASLVKLTQSAADDLDVNLKVYSANNRDDTMRSQVKAACADGTDGILFMNYENIGEEILTISKGYEIPAILYNTGFEDPAMIPRKQFPFWIGSVTPDDVRAGALLAERLIKEGKRSGKGMIRMLAIEGNPLEKSSRDRVRGMRSVVSNRDDVVLYGVVNAGKSWSRARAREVLKSEIGKYPDINTVWTAGDDIALGVLDALEEMGESHAPVMTGGIDWSDDALESIQSGRSILSVGGHILEGAWALILMHDYLKGLDFSQENTVFKTRMHAIDGDNVEAVSWFLFDQWDNVDFKPFSKDTHGSLLYRFDLLHLIETVSSTGTPLKISDEERRWLNDHPRIRLGIDMNWPPFESLDSDGYYMGMVADYVKIIEDRLGVRCIYSPEMSWSDTLTEMTENRLDMIAAIASIPPHEKMMHLTAPYLSFPLVVITDDRVNFVKDIRDLVGKKVVMVKDYSEYKILSENYSNIDFQFADTTVKALELVSIGEAYAYVGNLAVANYAIKTEHLTHLKVSGTIPQKLEISMGVRKDWPLFAGLVSRVMASISEAERAAIYERWIPLRYEHGFDYTLFWKFAGGALFILSVLVYWTRRLSLLNRALKREIAVRVTVEDALRREQERTKELAVTDPLTGLFNRRKLDEVFPLEIRRLRRSGHYLVFSIMDIDYFKQYNDCYGHQMGDDALVRVGALLRERCNRSTDYIFRLGGEEFGILFVAHDVDRVMTFIDDLRAAIEGLGIPHRGNRVADSLTVSFGLVVSNQPTSIDAMYKSADRALYRAKEGGRNRTEMDGTGPSGAEGE